MRKKKVSSTKSSKLGVPNAKRLRIKIPHVQPGKLFGARFKRERSPKALRFEQAIEEIPRITNETVAEQREAVLSTARKYIYPLQHSRHRIVVVSSVLFVTATLIFFTYTMLALYKFHSTSAFVYRITQVLPFPVAKVGSRYVSYESYLFELRHYIHYYQTQQNVDYSTTKGKQQLADFKKRALDQVVDYVYVKDLAAKNKVTVSDREVTDAMDLLKDQNRLGSSDQVLSDVLKQFWGWSIADFRRELKQQLLAQKLESKLDVSTANRATNVLNLAQNGADFASLAKKYSDDVAAKSTGGEYGFLISKTNRDISPQVVDAIFKLSPGQISPVVNNGGSLEIEKLLAINGDKRKAAHIVFTLKPLSDYLDPLKKAQKPRYFIPY